MASGAEAEEHLGSGAPHRVLELRRAPPARRERAGRVPSGASNWPAPPDRPDRQAWTADVALLRAEHERLVEAVREVDLGVLGRRPPGSKRWTYGELLVGIAMHDAYHTGQIQLLKRLWLER